MTHTLQDYRPIAEYALIGDAHSAALVATDGSINWCCWPRFDSPAVFCRLLDARRGGYFRVGPACRSEASRSYVGRTNLLATTFHTERGRARVTDCMPVEPRGTGDRETIAPSQEIIRLIEGLDGEVEFEVVLRPTFDFARKEATTTIVEAGVIASSGDERLWLRSPARLSVQPTGEASGRFRAAAGDRLWVTLAYASDEDSQNRRAMSDQDAEAALSRTLRYWNQWSELCTYRGPYEELVRRSALTLKLLTFNPTGALVASPTTSLPEEIGGARNWDYRFTWLRDSSLILDALHGIGYQQEAVDFFDWLDDLSVKREEHVRIMYTVTGQAVPPEQALDHLEGYRRSLPVRIGNAAATQVQLDVSGEILEAAHLCYSRLRAIQPDLWRVLRAMADGAAEHWHEPDHGIWEMRSAPRHFLHSKLLCWIALDRAVRLAATGGLQVPYWRRTRDEIRHAILSEGFDRNLGAFVQAFDHRVPDASALVIPLVGFLPATDPRVLSTVECIRTQLTSQGLVYRYRIDDGLPGGEATFTLCSFWLVDNLALSGALDEARELFERITSYANDVGLLSEQIQPATGELLGNFPQGFTHLALIRSAINIGRTETEGAEVQARVPGERSQARVAAIR